MNDEINNWKDLEQMPVAINDDKLQEAAETLIITRFSREETLHGIDDFLKLRDDMELSLEQQVDEEAVKKILNLSEFSHYLNNINQKGIEYRDLLPNVAGDDDSYIKFDAELSKLNRNLVNKLNSEGIKGRKDIQNEIFVAVFYESLINEETGNQ